MHLNYFLSKIAFLFLTPNMWPEILRRVKVKLGERLLPNLIGHDRSISEQWCHKHSISDKMFFAEYFKDKNIIINPIPSHYYKYAFEAEIKSVNKFNDSGTGGAAKFIYNICENLKVNTALETGVDRGWSSVAILSSLENRDGSLLSVDIPKYKSTKGLSRTGEAIHPDLKVNWRLLVMPDQLALKKINSECVSFDFIHYDSDKSYWGRIASYQSLWGMLKDKGVLMTDDVSDNTAFRDFCLHANCKYAVVKTEGIGSSKSRYVGIALK